MPTSSSAPPVKVILTPHTITQAKALREEVAKVRVQDYCIATEEHEIGVQALAVPLRNMQGRTVAALNVVLSGGLRSDAEIGRASWRERVL